MKILSLNARIWTRDRDKASPYYWKTRMAAMKRMIETTDPDVICFQEMIFPATTYIPKTYRRVGLSFSHHIYVKKGMKTRLHRFRIHSEKVEFFYEQDWWLIINVHSSWEGSIHTKVLKQIQEWVNNSRAWYSNCIACGDFNNPPAPMDEMVLIDTEPSDTRPSRGSTTAIQER